MRNKKYPKDKLLGLADFPNIPIFDDIPAEELSKEGVNFRVESALGRHLFSIIAIGSVWMFFGGCVNFFSERLFDFDNGKNELAIFNNGDPVYSEIRRVLTDDFVFNAFVRAINSFSECSHYSYQESADIGKSMHLQAIMMLHIGVLLGLSASKGMDIEKIKSSSLKEAKSELARIAALAKNAENIAIRDRGFVWLDENRSKHKSDSKTASEMERVFNIAHSTAENWIKQWKKGKAA